VPGIAACTLSVMGAHSPEEGSAGVRRKSVQDAGAWRGRDIFCHVRQQIRCPRQNSTPHFHYCLRANRLSQSRSIFASERELSRAGTTQDFGKPQSEDLPSSTRLSDLSFCWWIVLRATNRKKDGKDHRYFSVVENQRVSGGTTVQRTVLYLARSTISRRRSGAGRCRSLTSRSSDIATPACFSMTPPYPPMRSTPYRCG
jgi:hypothetical protein